MAKTYKVWIEIEEYDDETDESIDHDVPFAASAECETLDHALAVAEDMHLSVNPWFVSAK